MTHYELCKKTAERFTNKQSVALWEYQTTISDEHPDVLIFGNNKTVLYEIKTSVSDFRADYKKECRTKIKTFNRHGRVEHLNIQNPHLGNYRYFVSLGDFIKTENLPEGWGLLWFKNGRFYIQKESSKFMSNIKKENDLLIHAIRAYASGRIANILLHRY